jgi:hypothetical protein
LGKVMTSAERSVLEWLMKKYPGEEIKYNYNKSPDFVLTDGRKIEVKRPAFGTLYFSKEQWEGLSDDTEIAVVDEKRPEPFLVKFSKIKSLHSLRKPLECNGKKYIIRVASRSKLIIECSEETKRTFLRYAVDYRSHEDALRALLTRAGILHEGFVF